MSSIKTVTQNITVSQKALQEIVGKNVAQKGSWVGETGLRFDFANPKALTFEQIQQVEKLVNKYIADKMEISKKEMPIDEAKKTGAMALFGEKYGDIVRVVNMGGISIELCGGTHTANTKNISSLAIYSCESKGSNVYRIEAATSDKIESTLYNIIKPYNDEMIKLLMKARGILEEARNEGIKLEFDVEINNDKPTSYKDIIFNKNQLQYIQQEVKDLEKKFFDMKEKKTLENLDIYLENLKDYNGTMGIVMQVENKDVNLLKSIADSLVNKVGECFVFFANVKDNGSINFIARSTNRINAGLIVKDASVSSEGNGGGSPTFAQGGGKTTSALDKIFEHVEKVLRNE